QCSDARRTEIDERAREGRGVACRYGIGVIQVDKPGRGQEVGDADNRRAAKDPTRARKVLRRPGLVHNRAADERKADQAVQPGSDLRNGRPASGVDEALTESVAEKGDEVDLL